MNSVQSPSRNKTIYHWVLREYVNKNTYKRLKNLTQIAASRKETADLGHSQKSDLTRRGQDWRERRVEHYIFLSPTLGLSQSFKLVMG